MMRVTLASLAWLLSAVRALSDDAGSQEQRWQRPGPVHTRDSAVVTTDPREGFTMVIATYQRDELLPALLSHLTTTPPPSLRHIVVVWQNIGVPLPALLLPPSLDHLSTSGVAVTVRQSTVNSMNERFRPLTDWGLPLDTDAVMIMDDDIILLRESLEWGFQTFRESNPAGSDPNAGRIVGFAGRDWDRTDTGEWGYVVQPSKTYSMVLSNAAWFRREWLERYWGDDDEMVSLRAYVDEVFNCDDLLINYVVSNMTHRPPLLLQPKTPLRSFPTLDGLWNRAGSDEDPSSPSDSAPTPSSTPSPTAPKLDHFTQREYCIGYYFDHFARHAPAGAGPSYPLVRTSTAATQDVVDHGRWLHKGEPWEAERWEPVRTDEDDEHDRFEDLLDGMSEDELDQLLEKMERQQAADEEARVRVIDEL